MKKRALATFLCLIMVFALLPTTALAGTTSAIIGDKTLTDTYCYYVNGEGGSPGAVYDSEPGNGAWNAHYEASTSSLILKNLDLTGYNGIGVNINTGAVSTLKLNGTNNVSTADTSDANAVEITGTGSFNVQQEGTSGSLAATANGSGNGIYSIGMMVIVSGSINGTANGSGNGIEVSGYLIAQGGSAYGNAISGIGVKAVSILYDTAPDSLISGRSQSGCGVNVIGNGAFIEPVIQFYHQGTLIASGEAGAVTAANGIQISTHENAPTNYLNWCSVTTSENADGSNRTTKQGSEVATGAEEGGLVLYPYTYTPTTGVKYLEIAPADAGDEELVLSVTGTGAPAAKGTDYTYSARKLNIIRAGSYTLSMAEGVSTTTHNVELTADGVELTLDNVKIEGGTASPLKSSAESGNTLKLNGTNELTAQANNNPGLAVNGKLTIADGDGTGSLTATGSGEGAGIGVSGTSEGMELTIQSGTVTAYGGEGTLGGTLIDLGPGIGSNHLTRNGDNKLQLPKPVSVTITGGKVHAEGAGGIATGIDVVSGEYGSAQITVIILGGDVTGRSTYRGCGIGGAKARVEISGGTVVGESYDTLGSGSIVSVGAGIGGTDHTRDDGQAAGVFISGGTVTATGSTTFNQGISYGGAGIGGGISEGDGTYSQTAKVEISGGTVTATGGQNAAGIGGSSQINSTGGYANVTISGGTVTATGGKDGRAIGAGKILNDTTSSVSIAPGADKAMLLKFADASAANWSGVTDSVSVGSGTTFDYKADAHYNKLSAHISTAYAVSGTVKDEAGTPVEGAAVSSGGQSATTTATGAYKLMLENGSHAVSAAQGNLSGTINVTVGNAALTGQDITLTVAPSGYDYAPPEVTVYNDPSQPKATIWLTGSGIAAGDQLITERNPSGSDYRALLKLAGSNDVFATYNIRLKSGSKGTGSALHLTFDLNEKYAGQEFTLVHKKADGTYEYFYATADAKGDLTFGPLYELSPFMLVKGRLNLSALGVPDTGEAHLPWPGIALLGLLGLAAVYITKRKRA